MAWLRLACRKGKKGGNTTIRKETMRLRHVCLTGFSRCTSVIPCPVSSSFFLGLAGGGSGGWFRRRGIQGPVVVDVGSEASLMTEMRKKSKLQILALLPLL